MRYAAVAGQFYAGDEATLKAQIERCYTHDLGPGSLPRLPEGKAPRKIKGLVVPHAGYMYSGPIAAHGYFHLARDGFPETFVIIGPNHTGHGSHLATTTEDFVTPLGKVSVDKELARSISTGIVVNDIISHRFEHSIEVQLPFLQHINPDVKFVPVCMMAQDYKTARELGNIILEATKGRDVVVVASTDFSHYIPKEAARQQDKIAIDSIVGMDSKELLKSVQRHNISMCGYGPVAAMLEAVNGTRAELIKYATSGDVRPMRDVVGYGAIVVE